ncbi:hypothetical protein J2T02_002614 [Chitinophaga terrae (ex Kim and Jung 2007)]|nr:hypothetical protein [Chitinophaga terrae (ex Kim and Jung 2007)]
MRKVPFFLTTMVVIAAAGAAFGMANIHSQANVYTDTTYPCHLILCNINPILGTLPCPDPNPKYCVRTPQGICEQPILIAYHSYYE